MGNDRALLEGIARALGVTPTVFAITVQQVVDLYGASAEAQGLADWPTEKARLATVCRVLGDRNACMLAMSDVDRYRQVRRDEGKKPATRNREVVRLGAALRWAAERGHLPAYPLPRLKQEAERNERSTYRSEADVIAIVEAAHRAGRLVIAAIIATGYDSGLRRREICRLTLSQLDTRDGVIEIRALDTKAKRARVTILSDWAAELIAAIDRPAGSPWVFPTIRGKPYHPRTVTRYYQDACVAAGVQAAPGERNFFHDLRAGFADKHVEIGTRTPHIMRMAGWEDYRTARRYMRRKDRDIARAAKVRLEDHRRPAKRSPPTDEGEPGAMLRTKVNE